MKKVLALALSLSLILAIGIAGTLAWLTSTPEAITNTFTIGNLAITIDEPSWDSQAGNKLYPGAVLDKDPTVTVAADSEKSYVFMKLAVDPAIAAIATLNMNSTWQVVPGKTDVYYKVVDATTTDTALPALFTTVTVNKDATNTQIAAAANKTIVVTAYAIQFEGFNDAAAAFAQFTPAT